VPVQESLESVVVDVKPFGVPESVGTCILALEEQALEDLPPDWIDGADLLGHVFVFVVGVDDCVELEEDVVLAAPVTHLYDLLEVVLVALSSTDRLRSHVKRCDTLIFGFTLLVSSSKESQETAMMST
jgi:hypothetical protein